MKIDRVLELLKIERECVTRQSACNEKSKLCDRNCGECDIAQNDLEVIEMYDFVISMVEALQGRSKWISVEDRLPPDNQVVIGYTPVDGYMFVGFHKTRKYSFTDASYSYSYWYIITSMRSTKRMCKKVTHWMPLPEPPKEVTQ